MRDDTDVKEVARRCLQEEANAIMSVIPQLDDAFNHAVQLLYHCQGKVVVTGVGKSGHVAAKMAATLASTGTPSFYLNPLDAFHGDLGMLSRFDVMVALSNSGQTDELLRIVPFLKEHQIPLVGISGNANSLLARYSDVHIRLHVSREACPLNLAPTSSTTAQMALGDALAVALMEARHFDIRDYAQVHPGGSLGKRLLTTARDVMRSDDLPTIDPEITLGEAIILVSRGKLGLAVAMVDNRIVGLITDGDVRRAMESLKQDFFNVPVSKVMTRTPKCVRPDTKIDEIQRIMHQNKIHTVLVVDGERHLLGVVDHFSCMI